MICKYPGCKEPAFITKSGQCKGLCNKHRFANNDLEVLKIRYGEEQGKRKFEEIRKKLTNLNALEGFIKRYGEEGKQKYKEYCKKLSYTNTLEYYIEKYGEEGKQKYKEYCEKLSLPKSFVKKYGEKEGKRKTKEWKEKESISNTLEGFIKRYGEKNGSEKYFSRLKLSRMTLDNFIRRFGEKTGEILWKEWKKTQDKGSLKYFTKKYGKVVGEKRYKETNKKKRFGCYYSKISQKLFWILYENLKDKENVNFAELNNELKLYSVDALYSYDFCYNNKIIEFHGDKWHGNPALYEKEDIMINSLSCEEIWKKDERKKFFAKKREYDYLTVWENDYKKDPDKVVENCLKFLGEK